MKVQPFSNKLYGIDLTSNSHLEALSVYPNIEMHYKSTNEFFETFSENIDMAFIDADHCYESAKKDFENVLKRLNPGGIILLHDTDPEAEWLINPGYCGDSYKIVKWLEQNDDVNIITLPLTEAGLSMVTKKNNTRTALRQNQSNVSLISPS